MEWSLAQIVGNDYKFDRSEAFTAAALYRIYSGRAGPVLSATEVATDPSRRIVALRAIRQLQFHRDERVVFRYACDAARVLHAFRVASSPPRQVYSPFWELVSTETLFEAYRVSRGELREEIWQLIGAVGPADSWSRVQAIEMLEPR